MPYKHDLEYTQDKKEKKHGNNIKKNYNAFFMSVNLKQ